MLENDPWVSVAIHEVAINSDFGWIDISEMGMNEDTQIKIIFAILIRAGGAPSY